MRVSETIGIVGQFLGGHQATIVADTMTSSFRISTQHRQLTAAYAPKFHPFTVALDRPKVAALEASKVSRGVCGHWRATNF